MLKTEELKGKTILIHGDADNLASMTISFALRMQKDEKVLFIDTIGCMTPKYVEQFYHKKIDESLDKIFISRPANYNDLSLFSCKLDSLFRKSNIKVLVISSINSLFFDVHKKEVKEIFGELVRNINYLTKKYGVITVIGNMNEASENTAIMNRILSRHSDRVYAV